MVNGSLAFDGYMDEADTQAYLFPEEAADEPLDADRPLDITPMVDQHDELPNGDGITEPDHDLPEHPSKKVRTLPPVPAFKPSQPDTSHVPQWTTSSAICMYDFVFTFSIAPTAHKRTLVCEV